MLNFSVFTNLIPFSFAFLTIASANGCCEFFSTLAVNFSSSFSSIPILIISVTSGLPLVKVPVLSNNIVFKFLDVSSTSLFLIRIPSSAPRPTPTVTAVGIARPRAHGQAMTSIEINRVRANSKELFKTKYHTMKDIIAIESTIGMK